MAVNIAAAAEAAKRVAEAYKAARASGQSEEEAALSTAYAKPEPAAAKAPFSFVIPKNKSAVPAGSNALAIVPVGGQKPGFPGLPGVPDDGKPARPRNSKWGPDPLHNHIVRKGRSLALQIRIGQISTQLELGNLDQEDNDAYRSPSPPPVYDTDGQRLNTREARKKEQLDSEKREAVAECISLDPLYKPPPGYRPVLKEAKLYIPPCTLSVTVELRGHSGCAFSGGRVLLPPTPPAVLLL